MENSFEEFRTYLPKYLSLEGQTNLFKELKQFPENIDDRMFTSRLINTRTIFQGDALADVWVSNLPDPTIKKARVLVLSNTCDVAPENRRLLGPRLLYCPIIQFGKYKEMIQSQTGVEMEDHLAEIKRQRHSGMFYLPASPGLGYEAIALLDRVNNCDLQTLPLDELLANRLFTLSDYGFYLFLFKLSVHLTRLREGVARS